MNGKGRKTKNQANINNSKNVLSQQELSRRIAAIETDLKSSTWKDMEVGNKFDKNAKLTFISDDMLILGCEIGFAVFFHNFSTFLGRAGIYLEDLFVLPEYRGRGFGKAFLVKLAETALERGCGRLEWACLDWNVPSIEFYKSLGAVPMDDWTVYRADEETMRKLVAGE